MTCGQRVSTPYGSGLIVGFRGWTDAIVSLDDGGYTTLPVPESDRTDVRFPLASRARAWDNDAAEYSGPIAHNVQRPGARLYSERRGVGSLRSTDG